MTLAKVRCLNTYLVVGIAIWALRPPAPKPIWLTLPRFFLPVLVAIARLARYFYCPGLKMKEDDRTKGPHF